MGMVTAYSAKRGYDIVNDRIISPPWKGTQECLRRTRLKSIPESAEEIDDAKLDEEGRYYIMTES
jgi:hypothetical protein